MTTLTQAQSLTPEEQAAAMEDVAKMRGDANEMARCINISRYGFCNVCTRKIGNLLANADRLEAKIITLRAPEISNGMEM